MSDGERLRRDDPARTGPIRNFSNLYRPSDSWDLGEAGGQAAAVGESGAATYGDAVAHGVELGYQVIQEQIAQGQRIAEQLSSQSYSSGAMAGDLREITDRAWRYLTDLGALWVDFLTSMAVDGEFLRKLLGALTNQTNGAPAAGAAASTNGGVGVLIDIACDRPTRVSLDLRPHCDSTTLLCQALRALDAEKPPITEVTFERAADGALSLRVRVPDGHPVGVYFGAVIDPATVQPRGTLSVSVA